MTTILSNFRVAILAALATVHCIPSAKASPINIDAITIKAGEVYVLGSGPSLGLPPPFVVVTGTISIAPGFFVDLLSAVLIVQSTPFSTVYGYVVNGFGGGTWLGDSGSEPGGGIGSSSAANDSEGLTAVGIINNAEANYTEFHGVSLSLGTETLVAYAYIGDANLDGDVTAADPTTICITSPLRPCTPPQNQLLRFSSSVELSFCALAAAASTRRFSLGPRGICFSNPLVRNALVFR